MTLGGGGGRGSRPGYSLLTLFKWMDRQLAILRCFYIIPAISGRWEKDNKKLCAMKLLLDLYMYFIYQVRRR